MEKLEVLKKSDVFHYLDEKNLAAVAEMCKAEVFEPGTIIFRQDKEADKIYIIEEGLISLLLELGPTDKRQMQAASNFQAIGWTATIPPFRHLATAKVLEHTKVLTFDGKQLRNLIDTNPKLCAEIAGGVAYVISERLKTAYTQLMGCTYQD